MEFGRDEVACECGWRGPPNKLERHMYEQLCPACRRVVDCDECAACGSITSRWEHGEMTSYPLCSSCHETAQQEAEALAVTPA